MDKRKNNNYGFDPYSYLKRLSPFGQQVLNEIISDFEDNNPSTKPNIHTQSSKANTTQSNNTHGPPIQIIASKNNKPNSRTQVYANETDYSVANDNFISLLVSQLDFQPTQVDNLCTKISENASTSLYDDNLNDSYEVFNQLDKCDDINTDKQSVGSNKNKETSNTKTQNMEIFQTNNNSVCFGYTGPHKLNDDDIGNIKKYTENLLKTEEIVAVKSNIAEKLSKFKAPKKPKKTAPENNQENHSVTVEKYLVFDQQTISKNVESILFKHKELEHQIPDEQETLPRDAVEFESDIIIVQPSTSKAVMDFQPEFRFLSENAPRNTFMFNDEDVIPSQDSSNSKELMIKKDKLHQTTTMLDSLNLNELEVNGSQNSDDFMDPYYYLKDKMIDEYIKKKTELDQSMANYFPSQEVLSQKVWQLNIKPNAKVTNNKKDSGKYKVEVDTKVKGNTKRLNQLKLSDMIPAKKGRKTSPKNKSNKNNNRGNKNVTQWLSQVDEFINTDDVGFSEIDIDKLVEQELKTIECGNKMELDIKNDNIDKKVNVESKFIESNESPTEIDTDDIVIKNINDLIEEELKSFEYDDETNTVEACVEKPASSNAIQTVLANNNGKISYRKDNLTVNNNDLIEEELKSFEYDDETNTVEACVEKPASSNAIQTVLANNNGKMSYRKDNWTVNNKEVKASNRKKSSANGEQTVSKRKHKFIPPLQKNITRIDVNYNIKDLDGQTIEHVRNILVTNFSVEIGFTIVFSEGFCLMSKIHRTTEGTCHPIEIMFYILKADEEFEYYFIKLYGLSPKEKQSLKILLNDIMISNTRVVCYEAQELIMLLFDMFHYDREEICLKWDIIDPKIGCFLLDPDSPPQTFSQILSQLSMNKDFEVTNSCPKQKAAYLLNQLSECCRNLYEKLIENDLWRVFVSMETRLITILSAMELRGLCLDLTVLTEIESILNSKLKDIEKRVYEAAGKCFHLNSPVQLRKILFDELQLDTKHNIQVKETLKLGAKSTSESVLRSLVSLHPLPGLILHHRNIHKAKTTFVDSILNQAQNGIIRTSWEQTSAATGRIVSCNPNLQAFPKQPLTLTFNSTLNSNPGEGFTSHIVSLRNAFIPRSGYTFVAADFQHIECRVFAHLTQDKILLESFKQDVDIFSALTVKWMDKKSVNEISIEDRNKTKHLVYALMYGAGAHKLAEILNMEVSQTSGIIYKFLVSFPSLRTFKETILKECKESNGVLRSIYGRVRRFQNINSLDQKQKAYCERQAINFVIQGSAADICKLAMIATEHRLANLPNSLGHHLLLQIHDELVWEVPDDNINTFIDVVQEVMQHSGEFCGELSVPLPVSIVKGKSWGQMS